MSAAAPAPDAGLRLVVAHRGEAADGVVELRLRDPSGADLPPWEPGAHIDVLLGDDLVRQYSLCGAPADRSTWRIAVLREPGGRGGSAFVHDALRTGDVVRVRGPRNHFALEPAPRYVFVAGGIGITPILPMLTAATAAGAGWRLVYGGRTAASMAFVDELRAEHGDRVRVLPQDEHGLLDLDVFDDDTLVYCCGPPALLDAIERRGRPGSLRVERFAPVEPAEPVRTGTVLTVPPDRSVLEVLEGAGVQILSSCREGTCGTCETGVLEGTVDHRDSLLDPAERAAHDTMFVCVSRAGSRSLRLDL